MTISLVIVMWIIFWSLFLRGTYWIYKYYISCLNIRASLSQLSISIYVYFSRFLLYRNTPTPYFGE
jgi:hypothetical protein